MSKKNINPNDMKRMFENWNPTAEEFEEFTEQLSKLSISASKSEEYVNKEKALAEFKRIYFDNPTVIRCSELVLNGLPTYSIPDSAENKREWTPANDPPKKSGRYLAYIVNEYDEELQYQMTAEYIARPRSIEGLSPWCVDDECASNNVVAWMPLPEPYKAESEG